MAKKLSRYERREREDHRRWDSTDKPIALDSLQKLSSVFQKKASSKLKTFYLESQRLNTKIPELFAKLEECGIQLDNMTVNSVAEEDLLNFRKRARGLTFKVAGMRYTHKVCGEVVISPASIKIELHSRDLPAVTTRNGFRLPLFSITYYRTLNVRDNYLIALSGGGWRGNRENDVENEVLKDMEVPF